MCVCVCVWIGRGGEQNLFLKYTTKFLRNESSGNVYTLGEALEMHSLILNSPRLEEKGNRGDVWSVED